MNNNLYNGNEQNNTVNGVPAANAGPSDNTQSGLTVQLHPHETPAAPVSDAAPAQNTEQPQQPYGSTPGAQQQQTYGAQPQQQYGAQPGMQQPQPQPSYGPQQMNPPYGAQQGYTASQARPNYGAQNPSGTSSHMYTSYNPAPTPQKKEKKSSGVSRGALAVVCVCTILLSCASGFIGAYLATGNSTVVPPVGTDSGSSSDAKEPSVIFQTSDSPAGGMSSDNGSNSYYNVAQRVHASVVEITTEHLVNSYFQYVTQGAGSGIILTTDGYIMTNNHVIADTENNNALASAITVRMTDGSEFEATIVGTDADSDIAILKINAENLSAVVTGNSDNLAVGEEVVAVGNPLGELGGTVTNGIISALDREINVDGTKMNLLQTNAAINPGNSGGGLFNMAGELIGVVNAKSSGTGIEGLGFAIPVNDAVHIAEQLITQGYVSGKPYLGLSLYDVTSYQQALYYNLRTLGVYVMGVEEGTNDDIFKQGDRIIDVDGQEISTSEDVSAIIKTHAVGDKITFTIYRNGKRLEVEATCYERIPTTSQPVEFEK